MILLKNAQILDANHCYDRLDVLTDGKTIIDVKKQILADCRTVDLEGYTLMPGIFDAHVHLAPARVPDDWIFDKCKYKQWAEAGVLGIRDMGLHTRSVSQFLQFQSEIDSFQYPRITTFGPFIYAPGDIKGPFPTDTSPEKAGEYAEELIASKLPGIKLMLNMKSNAQTKSVVSAVAEAANRAGVHSAAHIYVSSDIQLLLDCGIREAAHSPVDLLPDELILKMKDADMTIVPTVANYYRMYRDGLLTEDQFHNTVENIGKCYRTGVRIGFGTDFMLTEDRPFIGYMVPTEEMRLMHQAGMPVQAVITSATKHSAYLCGFSDMGTITTGMSATMIAVKGEVDTSFKALDHVSFVMNRGTILYMSIF